VQSADCVRRWCLAECVNPLFATAVDVFTLAPGFDCFVVAYAVADYSGKPRHPVFPDSSSDVENRHLRPHSR
jgi:hypothetical protein